MSVLPASLDLAALRLAYGEGGLAPRGLMAELRARALADDHGTWITVLDEAALEPYLARLEALAPGELPLYGVPFAIKDNIDLAGVPTTAACPDFARTPERSAPVVQALVDAGAIPLGKANMDQFATGLVGTRSPYGEARNAFNPDYIAGGSSAGSALATALGQVSFALGTDTAGSGRVPAVLNNVIGHKPSRGLLSARGVVPACRSLDCVSLFALCCDDVAALWDIVAVQDPADALSRPNAWANRSRYYRGEEQTPGFRFGVPSALDFRGDADCAGLFESAVSALRVAGGEPVEIDFAPFIEAAQLLYGGPWLSERRLAVRGVAPTSLLPVIRQIILAGEEPSAAETFAAGYRLAELRRCCDAVMAGVDVVLAPTTPTVFHRAEVAAAPIDCNAALGTYTNFMNLLDYCATAVPVGLTTAGVPWGVTLFGPALTDMRVLGLARRLQQACALPLGATAVALPPGGSVGPAPPPDRVEVAVCGAHLAGQPLNWQLTERGGTLQASTLSAACYRLYALPDGRRPALVRVEREGAGIEVEVWSLPTEHFGSFVAGIPEPLGMGRVELADGRWVSGFICEQGGIAGARDITAHGGWRGWLAARRGDGT